MNLFFKKKHPIAVGALWVVALLIGAAGLRVTTRRHWWTPLHGARVLYNGKPVPAEVYQSSEGWYLVRGDRLPCNTEYFNGFVVAPSHDYVCNAKLIPWTSIGSDTFMELRHSTVRSADFVSLAGNMYSKQAPCGCDDFYYYNSDIKPRVRVGPHTLEFTAFVLIDLNKDQWDTPRIKVVW